MGKVKGREGLVLPPARESVDGRQLKCRGAPGSQDSHQLQRERGRGGQHEGSFSACRPTTLEKRNRCVSIADILDRSSPQPAPALCLHTAHGRRRGTQIIARRYCKCIGTKFSKSRLCLQPRCCMFRPLSAQGKTGRAWRLPVMFLAQFVLRCRCTPTRLP